MEGSDGRQHCLSVGCSYWSQMDRWSDEWTDVRLDGRIDSRMKGGSNGWMEDVQIPLNNLFLH